MESITRYDAHCHIFTLKYALKEIKCMLHDMLNETYPWKKPSENVLMATQIDWRKLKPMIRELWEIFSAAAGSEEGNLNFLQRQAKKAFPNDKLVIAPLMMDIFYMYAYALDKDEDVQVNKLMQIEPVDEEFFQQCWNEIIDELIFHIKGKHSTENKGLLLGESSEFSEALQMIEEERSVKEPLAKGLNLLRSTADDYYHTEGFCYHMDNLMELVETRKGELLPFVAIDPRRPGIIDALVNGEFTTGENRFYGVKLYPRMGYHPQCKPLERVYEYCNEQKLPIIFHCGKKGFPPTDNWPHTDFGNPENFKPIVAKYPDLKIDFAHLGSSDDTYTWAQTIVDMINDENNHNVFTDLSSYTNLTKLRSKMDRFWSNEKLKTRLMFGTDFDVMYLADKGTVDMQIYYNNFKTVFTDAELRTMMNDVPSLFFSK